MRSPRDLIIGALALISAAALGWGDVRAEVAAEVDAFGTYVRTVVLSNASSKQLRIWTPARMRAQRVVLNPAGDVNGDLWPVIRENLADRGQPWVVWSRFTGTEYDLAWSRWSDGSWTPISWVAEDAGGDDLDPALAFDGRGRPHTAWWRAENGKGRIYLSLFLDTTWMAAFPVSDQGVDSRHPDLEVLPDGAIRVQYDTPDGRQSRIVTFASGATITDDINPFGTLTVTEEPVSETLSR